MDMLEVAAEEAVACLRAIRQRAVAAAETGDEFEGDLGLDYSRISKALRQTVMLHAKFEDEANKDAAQKAADDAACAAAEARRSAAAH